MRHGSKVLCGDSPERTSKLDSDCMVGGGYDKGKNALEMTVIHRRNRDLV